MRPPPGQPGGADSAPPVIQPLSGGGGSFLLSTAERILANSWIKRRKSEPTITPTTPVTPAPNATLTAHAKRHMMEVVHIEKGYLAMWLLASFIMGVASGWAVGPTAILAASAWIIKQWMRIIWWAAWKLGPGAMTVFLLLMSPRLFMSTAVPEVHLPAVRQYHAILCQLDFNRTEDVHRACRCHSLIEATRLISDHLE